MPFYPYECQDCGHDYEVVKSVSAIDETEYCPKCNSVASRYIAKTGGFIGAGDWDTAHYNPALGKVVKSNAEARMEAKRMGMEEIGNEPVDKIHKKFDTEREQKIQRRYDEAFSTSLGEVSTK